MEWSQLTDYAKQKYHVDIFDVTKGMKYCGCIAIRDLASGKWAAVFSQHWDECSNQLRLLCDIRCGQKCLKEFHHQFLSKPHIIEGASWVGVSLHICTDESIVFELLDRAMNALSVQSNAISKIKPYKISINMPQNETSEYKETPIKSDTPSPIFKGSDIPIKIQEMMELYEYGKDFIAQRCKNFYIQGKFMESYEDTAKWHGDYRYQYFATYHDLNIKQLRGYFGWRTRVRNGIYDYIPAPLAYMYIFELINGIGAESPMDSIHKLLLFQKRFVDSKHADVYMKRNLDDWIPEFAVLNNIEPSIVCKLWDEDTILYDNVLTILIHPDKYIDDRIFNALNYLSRDKLHQSPVITDIGLEGIHLLAETWRIAARSNSDADDDFLTRCFGSPQDLPWYPLENVIYYNNNLKNGFVYHLNSIHKLDLYQGKWFENKYSLNLFNYSLFMAFLHETERQLRIYFKIRQKLKFKQDEACFSPYVEEAIRNDQNQKLENARQKIDIHFEKLAQIRDDALITQNRLLTEEELLAEQPVMTIDSMNSHAHADEAQNTEFTPASHNSRHHTPLTSPDPGSLFLNPLQIQIMRLLLNEQPVKDLLMAHHQMPSIIADDINEKLYDAVGDNVLECDGTSLRLVDDYRRDILGILGDYRDDE